MVNFDVEFTSEAALDSVAECSHLSATLQVGRQLYQRLVSRTERTALCVAPTRHNVGYRDVN